jgi:HEAT repeat protein
MMGTEAAVEPLRAMLLNGKGLEISVAGEALARIGKPAAIDALLPALADPVPTGRWHAAMAALEAVGEPAAGSLVEMLNSDAETRRNNEIFDMFGALGHPARQRRWRLR